MPVVTEELAGSPVYRGSQTELSATRRLKIDWDDINAYLFELFPGASSGIPQLPALLPGSAYIFADTVTFKPFMGDDDYAVDDCSDGPNEYREAEVEVTYKTADFTQASASADQIVTRRYSVSGEFLTYKNIGIRWVGDSDNIKDPQATAGKLVPMIEHSLTLHRVENVPFATLRDLAGKVNDDTFEGAPAGTLLFLGAEITQSMSSIGVVESQVELRVAERGAKTGDGTSVGWNYAFKEEDGDWAEIETAPVAGGAAVGPVYPEGDFDLLF